MGEVYRADDLKLGVTVALKFLPRELRQDPSKHDRFLSEVRLARQISQSIQALFLAPSRVADKREDRAH